MTAEVAFTRKLIEMGKYAQDLQDEISRLRAFMPADVLREYDNLLAETRGTALPDLAAEANREYALAEEAAAEFVAHAIRCGEVLVEAREKCERRHWYKWLEENFNATTTTAKLCIRIATYRNELPEDVRSIDHARRALRGLPPVTGDPHAHAETLREEALRLRQGGGSLEEIAQELGVHKSTVHYWTNPQRRRDQYRRSRAARRALEQQEQNGRLKQAVRQTGGALAEAYAMAERLQDVLGQAHSEATDSEARRALSVAGTHYRKMRDEIVRALGVE
jgi:transposase